MTDAQLLKFRGMGKKVLSVLRADYPSHCIVVRRDTKEEFEEQVFDALLPICSKLRGVGRSDTRRLARMATAYFMDVL